MLFITCVEVNRLVNENNQLKAEIKAILDGKSDIANLEVQIRDLMRRLQDQDM